MKASIITVIITIITIHLWAQNDPDKLEHKLGFNIGATTGTGLSYKLQVNRFALQVVAFPYAYMNQEQYRRVIPSYGASVMFSALRKRVIDVYAFGGIAIYNLPGLVQFQNLGVGAGVEFHISRVFNIHVQPGIGRYNYENDFTVFFAFEAGLHFQLNPVPKIQKASETEK